MHNFIKNKVENPEKKKPITHPKDDTECALLPKKKGALFKSLIWSIWHHNETPETCQIEDLAIDTLSLFEYYCTINQELSLTK